MNKSHRNKKRDNASGRTRTRPSTLRQLTSSQQPTALSRQRNFKIDARTPTAEMNQTVSQSASDGYTNPSSFLGEASPLLSAGSFIRSGLTSNIALLTTIYRESWLAKKIIDMPVEDMTRAWYTLGSALSPEDLSALRRLESHHAIRNELINAMFNLVLHLFHMCKWVCMSLHEIMTADSRERSFWFS